MSYRTESNVVFSYFRSGCRMDIRTKKIVTAIGSSFTLLTKEVTKEQPPDRNLSARVRRDLQRPNS
jgi:hypothetical protein